MADEKRLIDANALQLEPDPWGGMNGVICVGRSGGKTIATVQAALKRVIDNAPTVDAEIVKHGRWIIKYIKNSKYRYAYCSECETMGSPQWKRCPVCEAKMDGGNEDG